MHEPGSVLCTEYCTSSRVLSSLYEYQVHKYCSLLVALMQAACGARHARPPVIGQDRWWKLVQRRQSSYSTYLDGIGLRPPPAARSCPPALSPRAMPLLYWTSPRLVGEAASRTRGFLALDQSGKSKLARTVGLSVHRRKRSWILASQESSIVSSVHDGVKRCLKHHKPFRPPMLRA